MSKRLPEHEKLLAEVMNDGWDTGRAGEFARVAAAAARRRQTGKRLATIMAAVALPVLLLLSRQRHTRDGVSALTHVPDLRESAYEIISDDEFRSLLRHRTVLVLPQENGAKKFVVLDR